MRTTLYALQQLACRNFELATTLFPGRLALRQIPIYQQTRQPLPETKKAHFLSELSDAIPPEHNGDKSI